MTELSFDVWATMMFSVVAFWGVASWALVRTLRQEEQKMDILQTEDDLDTHSPKALRDLRSWIEAHPQDPEAKNARAVYNRCVETLQRTDRHFYDWSDSEIKALDTL